MADPTGASLLVGRLRAWRVPRVFGWPGEAIAPVRAAIEVAGGGPEFVPARHGETVSFMAAGQRSVLATAIPPA
ncbi:thiamine pyrophosphate-binding protein [Micromonospora sp. KC213]|uniref:thiamine pyrophosphate-binding protein n=1 Tax=Micromonospora sp. KC213 TaxID=2530378 RepID=UPI00104F5BC9|nr:thiamine pyrophosphate-binding protein [Micromonospora sp. KC213]TDC31191.1 hypothetical protein E1166_28175 [Micromonospora sp. KC213]